MVIRPVTQNGRPIVLGVKLRSAMQQEARRLVNEWKITVSFHRRSEIAKQLAALNLLLGLDDEPRIGRNSDD